MTQTDIFVDPSIAGPDMLFSTGQVMDGAEAYAASLPAILGDPDPGWNITQWATPPDQIFDPTSVVAGDPRDADPVLGAARASWHTGGAQGGSLLAIYGQPGDVTFRLGATGGDNRDTFLQTTGYAPGTVTFDRQIDFTALERLSAAQAGTGTAIAFNGFTVFFNAAGNPSYDPRLPQTELFLQVPLTDFRGAPGPFSTITANDTYQQIYNVSSQTIAPDGETVADESADYLAFAGDAGPLHTVSIDLNQALLRMVRAMAAQNPAMASAYLDLSRWSLGSLYAGVETGGGDGADPASLTLDVAHPLVTRDDAVTVSADEAAGTVQSIDAGAYAETEDAGIVGTLSGSVDTVALSGAAGAQTFTGHGDDTVLVGDRQTATLHGLGSSLTVRSAAATTIAAPALGAPGAAVPGMLAIDGTATLDASGVFDSLSVQGSADGDRVSGLVLGRAAVSLEGEAVVVSLQGAADATLSGTNATFAAGSGQIVLQADGAAIDQNGDGSQIVFLNGHRASVTQSGAGTQLVVGAPATSAPTDPQNGAQVTLSGGGGGQTLWTGGSDAVVSADGSGSLSVLVQPGSSTLVRLAGETAQLDALGGALTVLGGAQPGSATLLAAQGSATIWGGAETLTASLVGQASLQVGAGSGTQTIFGGPGRLTVIASHDEAGSQTIVSGADPAVAATIFGGRTAQTIWTGAGSDTIVASVAAGDSTGTIQAFIQGGVSRYWGGTEAATLDNQAGILEAFLAGDGAASILASMTGQTNTTLHDFDSRTDRLVLAGVSDPAAVGLSIQNGSTILSFDDSRVTLDGLTDLSLTQGAGGVTVTGWR